MSHLNMSSLDNVPSDSIINPELWMEDDSVRQSILTDITASVVAEHVDLLHEFFYPSSEKANGTIYDYTHEVLSLVLLYLDFKDAVKEGDGDRVINIWNAYVQGWTQ